MKKTILTLFLPVISIFAAAGAFGMGADYPSDKPTGTSDAWPPGMKELVNIPNRVHGFFVNAEDVFFFSGTSKEFAAFLTQYSKIQPVEKHVLILHEGKGEAKSPWDKSGKPCDWKLFGCPESWLTENAKVKAGTYVLEVHFWTGGPIAFDKALVPSNVEVKQDK